MSSPIAALLRHDLPPFELEQQAIQRRRRMNDERNKRIFDPKVRTIGIDYDALNAQVREKEEIRQAEKDREQDYANYTTRAADVMQVLDIHINQIRSAQAKDLNDFQKTEQRPEGRREYDMNRPHYLRYDPPMRKDNECPVSGLQQFAGEDLQNARRIKEQHEQSKVWSYMLRKEKEEKEARIRLAKEESDRQLMEMDASKMAIAAETNRRNREEAERNAQYNKQLASQKSETEQYKKELDTAYAQQEIYDQSHGAFLTEARNQSNTANPGRVLVDSWKGMTVEQKYEILNTQERQRREAEERQNQQKAAMHRFDQNLLASAHAANTLEATKRQQEREKNIRIAEENRRLASDQKNRNEYMEKVVYQNAATGDYFNQFNTSSR